MQWWLAGLDRESTKKYNLAARWLLRQTGVVRQRGEEFSPSELEYQPEVLGKDFDGNTFVEKAEDVFAGIKKLMTSAPSCGRSFTPTSSGSPASAPVSSLAASGCWWPS